MTRASKAKQTQPVGMSWLALMPFPAFNPLNWQALALPRNAMLASLTTTRLALDVWRAGSDSCRTLLRQQQDELLKMFDAAEAIEAPESSEARMEVEDQEAKRATAAFVQPMVEATRAYGRVGRAFIVAQRDTLRAFSPAPEPPHAADDARPT